MTEPRCIYATITGCAAPAALIAVWCVPGVPDERRSPVCRQHLRYLHNTAQVLREEPMYRDAAAREGQHG